MLTRTGTNKPRKMETFGAHTGLESHRTTMPLMQYSTRLLDAVHLATRKLASQRDLDVVLQEVLQICIEAVGASGGTIYMHDPATRTLQFRYVLPREVAAGQDSKKTSL